MFYTVLKAIHVLSIVLWVGGMAFVQLFLRPSVAALPAPERLTLMQAVLARFFNAVAWAAGLSLVTGVWMIGRVAKQTVQSGGQFSMPLTWTVMAVLGVAMVLLFGHIRMALFPKLRRAVAAQDWVAGGAALEKIRTWVMVNLVLGVGITAIAVSRVLG